MNRIEKILEYFKKNAINCENKAVRTIDIANIFEINSKNRCISRA